MNTDFAPDTPPEIVVEGLHKAFGDHKVLTGVDLTFARGDVIAVVGGSGCGKTVLMNHILSELAPDAGRVAVRDHGASGAPLVWLDEINETQLDSVHQHWGVVFQRNALFSGTVFDNIALWLEEVKNLNDADITPIARRVLDQVALPDDADFLDTDVDSLSGGMAKRLAVARALAMGPEVIFYDEPTTGLDPTSSAQIHDVIFRTHHEMRPDGDASRTTIIITHDKDLLYRLRPRTVMLHKGSVFFDGPYAEFEASQSAIIRPYFETMPVLHTGAPHVRAAEPAHRLS